MRPLTSASKRTNFKETEIEKICPSIQKEREDWQQINNIKHQLASIGPYVEDVKTFNLNFKIRAAIDSRKDRRKEITEQLN